MSAELPVPEDVSATLAIGVDGLGEDTYDQEPPTEQHRGWLRRLFRRQ